MSYKFIWICENYFFIILQYNFGSSSLASSNPNFGQIFYDASGNNLFAVNGNSSSLDIYDTTPTDRGAYFSSSAYNKITLPPNDFITSAFNLGSTFSILM